MCIAKCVASVVNLQVAVGKDQCSRLQKPYGQWLTMHFIEVSFVRAFLIPGTQNSPKLLKSTGPRGLFTIGHLATFEGSTV